MRRVLRPAPRTNGRSRRRVIRPLRKGAVVDDWKDVDEWDGTTMSRSYRELNTIMKEMFPPIHSALSLTLDGLQGVVDSQL